EKLKMVGGVGKGMMEKGGVGIEVEVRVEGREGVKEGDFVRREFGVGLVEGGGKDERMGVKYGVMGEERNGGGGLFKGVGTMGVIVEMVKDMEEVCADG
ncbi:family 4 glycosyl hydrolase, partial [Bacillus pumilus]